MEKQTSPRSVPLPRALLRITGFLLVLALLLAAASFLVFPKNNGPTGGNPEYEARGFYGEAENSLDAMFIGNSNVYSSISPMELWHTYGYAAYTCGEVAQTIVKSEQLLDGILTCQAPQIILFETSVLFQPTDTVHTVSETLQQYVPILRYHNRWKYLKGQDWALKYQFKWKNTYKGYHYSGKVDPGENKEILTPSDRTADISPLVCAYMETFIETCRENNIRLVLITNPAVDWNTEKHNATAAFAEANGLEFLDLNGCIGDIGLDWTTDTRDKGYHLNYNGAKKVTDYLGQYIKKNHPLPDRRGNPDYASWENDWKAYSEALQKKAANSSGT